MDKTETLFEKTRPVADRLNTIARLDADPYNPDSVLLAQSTELRIGHKAGQPAAALRIVDKKIRRRGTGTLNTYFSATVSTFSTTKSGLVIHRSHTGRHTITTRLWAPPQGNPDPIRIHLAQGLISPDQAIELGAAVTAHLGGLPRIYDRAPLFDPANPDQLHTVAEYELTEMSAAVLNPWIDAPNAAAVATNLFGKSRYRKPLARAVMRIAPHTLAFYSLFRGLVPIDHIIGALEGIPTGEDFGIYLSAGDFAPSRALLRALPQTVLSRMLRQPDQAMLLLAIRDASRTLREHREIKAATSALPRLIEMQGQRNIREPSDIEALVNRLPQASAKGNRARLALRERTAMAELKVVNTNRQLDGLEPLDWASWKDPALRAAEGERHQQALEAARLARLDEEERIALLTEQEQIKARQAKHAKEALWCQQTTEQLDGIDIAGLTLIVARNHEQLSTWAAHMHNCIHSHYRNDMGLKVLAALVKPQSPDEPVLNLEISYSGGLLQILGRYNRIMKVAIDENHAQQVLERLAQAGVIIKRDCVGTRGLRIPEPVI